MTLVKLPGNWLVDVARTAELRRRDESEFQITDSRFAYSIDPEQFGIMEF